jgi:antitoxin (DNA-binding transcriptional repressor) of toxin-antitoxin stability system
VYTFGYTRTVRIETLSVREAREQLPSLLERFRNGDTAAVGVGAHRRTEAVVIPVAVYDELISERERSAASALASLRVETVQPSMDVHVITDRWVHGEISTAEMRERIKRLYAVDG